MYDHAVLVELYRKDYISKDKKRQFRRMVQKDVKSMRKFTEEKAYDTDEDILTLEDKIYYGSDFSDSDDNFDANEETKEAAKQANQELESGTDSEYLRE